MLLGYRSQYLVGIACPYRQSNTDSGRRTRFDDSRSAVWLTPDIFEKACNIWTANSCLACRLVSYYLGSHGEFLQVL